EQAKSIQQTSDGGYVLAGSTSWNARLKLSTAAQIRGDLNSDCILTPADAAIALEIAVGSRPCDAATLDAADVSGDGRVTSLDALMILQAAAGRIEL
ncbi:MAG: dockerin type I repeat-containing protein, partial [Euryarchaeota archaeon]|nr:dockerin type I repeat-containing protein [Euryarchaeota archaeon]